MIEKIEKIVKKFTRIDWILLGVLGAGLIFLIIFLISSSRKPLPAVEYLAGTEVKKQVEPGIWVDVSGAVVNPGVYQLASDARTKDALVAAGGLTDEADRDFVSTSLNLAAKIKDGDKIYVPVIGQEVLGIAEGKINLNKASAGELTTLDGIGEVRARSIIDNRPYASVDDLVTKKVLSASLLEKIREQVAVY